MLWRCCILSLFVAMSSGMQLFDNDNARGYSNFDIDDTRTTPNRESPYFEVTVWTVEILNSQNKVIKRLGDYGSYDEAHVAELQWLEQNTEPLLTTKLHRIKKMIPKRRPIPEKKPDNPLSTRGGKGTPGGGVGKPNEQDVDPIEARTGKWLMKVQRRNAIGGWEDVGGKYTLEFDDARSAKSAADKYTDLHLRDRPDLRTWVVYQPPKQQWIDPPGLTVTPRTTENNKTEKTRNIGFNRIADKWVGSRITAGKDVITIRPDGSYWIEFAGAFRAGTASGGDAPKYLTEATGLAFDGQVLRFKVLPTGYYKNRQAEYIGKWDGQDSITFTVRYLARNPGENATDTIRFTRK